MKISLSALRYAMFFAIVGSVLALAPAGCGEQEKQGAGGTDTTRRTVLEEDLFKKTVEEMEQKSFRVEISGTPGAMPMFGAFFTPGLFTGGGQEKSKYSQDGKGSWRTDRASDSFILNKDEKKGWYVKGKTAWEVAIVETDYPWMPYETAGPLTAILSMAPPRTGPNAVAPTIAGVDGVWEWDLSKSSMGPILGMGSSTIATATVPAPVVGTPGGMGPAQGEGTVTVPAEVMNAIQAQGTTGTSTAELPPFARPPVTLRVEFQGPEGLLSRIAMTNPGGTQEQIFTYSNVGDVPAEDFQLPAEVEEVRIVPASENPIPFPYMFTETGGFGQ